MNDYILMGINPDVAKPMDGINCTTSPTSYCKTINNLETGNVLKRPNTNWWIYHVVTKIMEAGAPQLM